MSIISVVIPCYNHAHYLPDALNSVLTQTFTDWEAVVVDDGSPDNTREVTRNFIDPRIRYIYQENQGLSAARNTGIQHAKGEYLAFLDADDEWEVDFLSLCISVLQRNKSLGFVYTRNSFIDQNGNKLPLLGGESLVGEQFQKRILQGGFFPPNTVLIRRLVFDELGCFDISLTSVEDWDMWLRVSKQYLVQGIDKPLARYRVYPGSMSTNAVRMHRNRIAVLTKQFGPPEGDLAQWDSDKQRAYGYAYRQAALGNIMQAEVDEGWRYLAQAVAIYPQLLAQLDTFYELALGDQAKGYRGAATLVDLKTNGEALLHRLSKLFQEGTPEQQQWYSLAFGNAYLALGMLSDQAGNWAQARRHLWQAVRHNPKLISPPLIRRFAKLLLGKRLVNQLKERVGTKAPHSKRESMVTESDFT